MADPSGDLSGTFFLAFVNACGRLGVSPYDLAQVLYSESGMRPSAHNPNGHAVGLFQLMPQQFAGVGWTKGWDEFAQLAAEDQVPYMERFFRGNARWMTTPAMCYLATFLPALLPEAAAAGEGWAGFVIAANDAALLEHLPAYLRRTLVMAYKWNPAFDAARKGTITLGDLQARLDKVCVGARWQAITDRIRRAQGLPTEPPPPPETEPDVGAVRITGTSEAMREALSEPRKPDV